MDEIIEAWDLVINQDGSKPSILYQYGGIPNLCDSGISWAGRGINVRHNKSRKGSTRGRCHKLLSGIFSAVYRIVRKCT